MTRRTKLIAALLAIALLAVTAFLLFPALFPGLDPSEEVSKGSDARIRAQDSSSGTGSLAKCTYSFSGTVRTVYSDGRELYKFQGGHRLEIEAKREAGDRSAVATYSDGTIRRETFPSGTTTVQMVRFKPLKTRWFEPDGSPRLAPGVGVYPELWPKVAEFFGDDVPSVNPWLEDDFRTPADPAERERLWGPVVREFENEMNGRCEERALGVYICEKDDGSITVYVFGDQSHWTEYPDGTKRWWSHPDRASAEHPFDEPMMPAPRTLEERERQFGPRTSQTDDEFFVYEEYADGTKYRYQKGTGRIRIVTPDYSLYEWSNEPPFFRFSSTAVSLCDTEGPYDVTYWADGTRRVRVYPSDTTYLNFKDRQPVCEQWRDGNGDSMEPGSADRYSEPALTEPMDISPPDR